MTPRTVVVEFLAIHARCAACGATVRIQGGDCDAYATWATAHLMPVIESCEVLVDGEYRRTTPRR